MLRLCEPVEPRALFRSTGVRPQKRKTGGSPSGAAAGDDAAAGAAGRPAKRTRPLPGDTDDATLTALQRIIAEAKAASAARAKEEISKMLSAAWHELDAALSALAQRHADERDAMTAEFQASRAATLRRMNGTRDEYMVAVKRFKAEVAPMVSGRGGAAADMLAAMDAAMEERQAETRQKHAAEFKSVRLLGRCAPQLRLYLRADTRATGGASRHPQVTKKMTSKLKQLEEDVTRMQASINTNAQVRSAIEQLLDRL